MGPVTKIPPGVGGMGSSRCNALLRFDRKDGLIKQIKLKSSERQLPSNLGIALDWSYGNLEHVAVWPIDHLTECDFQKMWKEIENRLCSGPVSDFVSEFCWVCNGSVACANFVQPKANYGRQFASSGKLLGFVCWVYRKLSVVALAILDSKWNKIWLNVGSNLLQFDWNAAEILLKLEILAKFCLRFDKSWKLARTSGLHIHIKYVSPVVRLLKFRHCG